MECISPIWQLFLGGLTQAQARNESNTIINEAPSNYWYRSLSMTVEMCVCSCLKYGFIYSAINPK